MKPVGTSARALVRRSPARSGASKARSRWEEWNALFWQIVPIKAETVERAMTFLTILAITGGVLAASVYAGIPQFVGTEIGQVAGRAGFKVKRVEVKGLDRMDSLTVYAVALDQHSIAMPLVDLDKVRGQLLQYGWIEDARISRRWPDTLVVDIIERRPTAVWQNNQKLVLIDGTGVVLEMVDPNAMSNLPLVIGPNANQEVERLYMLLDTVPALKPKFAGATWVGNRRWDIRFDTGETLALPEGEDFAANALKRFARIDGTQRLLGRGFVRFDMRDPAKFVVRLKRGADGLEEPTGLALATQNQAAPAPDTAAEGAAAPEAASAKPIAVPEAQPKAKPSAGSEAKPKLAASSSEKPKPDTKAKSDAKPKSEVKSKSEAKSKPEAKSISSGDAKPKPVVSRADAKPKSVATDTKPKSSSSTDVKTKSSTSPSSSSKPKSSTASGSTSSTKSTPSRSQDR